jgi:hypothetical protein
MNGLAGESRRVQGQSIPDQERTSGQAQDFFGVKEH